VAIGTQHEPHEDRHDADHDARAHQRAQAAGRHGRGQRAELHAQQEEDRGVEDEEGELPDRAVLQAGERGDRAREVLPQVHAAGDAGQHGGDVHRLGHQPGDVGRRPA
jgi:hypothetical protein